MLLPGDTGRTTMDDTKKPFITETFQQAAERVPALRGFEGQTISASLTEVFQAVDTIPGYSLMQFLPATGLEPSLFVFCATGCQCGACRHASDCAQHNEPAMPAGPCDCGAAPAPRVTPADVEAAIASEHYFTGEDGVNGCLDAERTKDGNLNFIDAIVPPQLAGLMVCVLVLKNGHLVTGEALLQDLSKPDPERARASARRRAFDKAYDMVVYAERERLAASTSIQLTPA